jgi:hypothetical protein
MHYSFFVRYKGVIMNKSSPSFRITEFIFRFIGLFIFSILAFSFGGSVANFIEPNDTAELFLFQTVFAMLGGLSGGDLADFRRKRSLPAWLG